MSVLPRSDVVREGISADQLPESADDDHIGVEFVFVFFDEGNEAW